MAKQDPVHEQSVKTMNDLAERRRKGELTWDELHEQISEFWDPRTVPLRRGI